MSADVCKNGKPDGKHYICTLSGNECPFWFKENLIDKETGVYKGISICIDFKPYSDHA